MEEPNRLRELARWYREFAEKTGNPVIWDLRLRRADDLDAEAERIERAQRVHSGAIGAGRHGGSILEIVRNVR
jgi:hypothetical protein